MDDDQLRRWKSRITDPYAQDLVEKIPPGIEITGFENRYSYHRYPEDKAWCGICEGRRHKNGFTAALSDGGRMLVGRVCGRPIFGDWSRWSRDIRDAEVRQTYLRRRDYLAPRLPELVASLRRWAAPCERFEASHRRFSAAMGPLHRALVDAARRLGGRLVAHERLRDLAEEARLGSATPVYTYAQTEIGVMVGPAYFADVGPADTVRAAAAALEEFGPAMAETAGVTTGRMRSLYARLRSALQELEAVAEAHRAAPAFFEPVNLRTVAAWATRSNNIPGSYEARGRELHWVEEDASMGLIPDFPRLNEEVLAQLRRGLGRE